MPVLTTKRTGGGGDSAARLPTRKQGYGFALRDRRLGGYKFSREVPIGSCIADFVCREQMLVVEVDGGQHAGILTTAFAKGLYKSKAIARYDSGTRTYLQTAMV